MISNIRSCCCVPCLNPDEKFYLEIKNETTEYLNTTIFYSIFFKEVTKPSPPFRPGKIERIVFPDNALGIFFQVFQTSFKPPALICTRNIPSDRISRFKIKDAPSGKPICIQL